MSCLARIPLALEFYLYFKNQFYLFTFRERGKGERKRGRETLMYERNINQLPLVCAQPGIERAAFGVQEDAPRNRAPWPGHWTHTLTTIVG